MSTFERCVILGVALFVVPLSGGCVTNPYDVESEAEDLGAVEEAVANTKNAIVTCQDATLYLNYSPQSGPKDKIRVLKKGNKIGLKLDAGYPSWAVVLDYTGPNQGSWGYLLRSCITQCNGPNNPVAGCF